MTGRSSRGHGICPSVSGRDRTEATHQGCESVFGGCESASHKVGELIEGRTGANTCRASETAACLQRSYLPFLRMSVTLSAVTERSWDCNIVSAENRVAYAKPETQRTEGPRRPASCGTERISNKTPQRDRCVPATCVTLCQGCSVGLTRERSPRTEITDNSLKPTKMFFDSRNG